jgi:hypothetical protein
MDIELTDQEIEKFDNELSEAVKAVSKNYPLSNFKRFVSQYLLYTNDEDQWTFDYESYVLAIYRSKCEGIKQHPMNWAPEHYAENWNHDKFKKSLESLRQIASGEADF